MSRPIQITLLLSAIIFVLAGEISNYFYHHTTSGWTWRTIGSPISILIGLVILIVMATNSIPKEEEDLSVQSM
jgi:uncharacterized membrane protein HdeD (DUF308 family)